MLPLCAMGCPTASGPVRSSENGASKPSGQQGDVHETIGVERYRLWMLHHHDSHSSPIAQSAEQEAVNFKVSGSSPDG